MKVLEKFKGLKLLFIQDEKGKVNYPPDTEEINNIEKIFITKEFRKSYPSPKKIIEYTKRYEQTGMIDKAIVVKKDIVFGKEKYILTDGYIRFLILKQNGITQVPVKFEKE